MTLDEYKKLLEKSGPLDGYGHGLLAAFELGYGQGLKENTYPFEVMFAVEQAIKNDSCYWEIESAYEDFEKKRKEKNNQS